MEDLHFSAVPTPTPKAEDLHFSAVRNYLFNMLTYAAVLHLWRPVHPSAT
jgi:hypothetical protein